MFWLGLSVGIIGGELSWRALAPIARGPQAARPPLRLIIALGAMFSSALTMFFISREPAFAGIARSTWEDGLLIWVASPVWVATRSFEAIVAGPASKWLRSLERLLNVGFTVLIALGLLDLLRTFPVASGVARYQVVLALNVLAFIAIVARWTFPATAGPAKVDSRSDLA